MGSIGFHRLAEGSMAEKGLRTPGGRMCISLEMRVGTPSSSLAEARGGWYQLKFNR